MVLLAMLGLYLIFFNARANLAIETPLLLGVHERFWLQPNMVCQHSRLDSTLLTGSWFRS